VGGVAPTLPAGVTRDQLGGISLADLRARLDTHVRAGDEILIHGGPPCDQFSAMNTVGPKNAGYPAKLAKAIRIVRAFISLAERYADAWTLENPATGHLWDREWLRAHLTPEDAWLANIPSINHVCVVDYCGYSWPMKKSTNIAFSSATMRASFARHAKRCPGNAKCEMCIDGPNGRKHAHSMVNLKGDIEGTTKDARYPMPPGLVVSMITELLKEANRVLRAPPAAGSPPAVAAGSRPANAANANAGRSRGGEATSAPLVKVRKPLQTAADYYTPNRKKHRVDAAEPRWTPENSAHSTSTFDDPLW
jgi:hypothetical protein